MAHPSLAPDAKHPWPTSVEQVGAAHKSFGTKGGLRAAVFGANDGLVSNSALVFGVAGASADMHVVLMSGVAGLLAGAFSMAAGEWISMRSQRDLFQALLEQERDEIARFPAEEAEELALIYNSRGVPMELARDVARRVLEHPDKAIDVLAREELGLDPDELGGSPWNAAGASFGTFALGALLPLLPLLLPLAANMKLVVAGAVVACALFGVGAAVGVLSKKSALFAGGRMLAIGIGAAALTWGVGKLLGVATS
jgi:VIT1/CCC1 family predicted Fe2+/Mn2+ transporter